MKAGEMHEFFEATMSAVAVKKRGDGHFATDYSAWRRLLRIYPVSERVQHPLISYAFSGTARPRFSRSPLLCAAKDETSVEFMRPLLNSCA
jgi:hypothetical protein